MVRGVGVRRAGERAGGAFFAAILLAVLLLLGCAEEELQVDLVQFESSPGGRLATVVAIESDEKAIVVAPAGDNLYVRRPGDLEWERRPARWPARVEEQGLEFFDVVRRATVDGDFVPRRYFVHFGEHLWTVGLPSAGQTPLLLWSDDVGRSWQEVPPPQEAIELRPAQLGGSALVPALRLIASEDSLHLSDGRSVWRWEPLPDGEVSGEMWKPVDLSGIRLGADDRELNGATASAFAVGQPGRSLPQRIRHYLPPAPDHDFELVTVYGLKLTILRRAAGEESFSVLTTLDAVDRDLRRAPDGTLYLLDHTRVLKSGDGGESWEELSIGVDARAPAAFSQVEFFTDPDPQNGVGYSLWLSGAAGSLWKSVDAGESWERLLEADLDGRAVTGVAYLEEEDDYWISTAGRGMWRSANQGERWVEANEELHAGQSFDAAVTAEGRVLVGSDAGLFLRAETSEGVQWEAIHDRATTAIFIHPDNGRIISGTLGGSIVVRTPEGELNTSEAAPLGRNEQIHFESPHLETSGLSPAAIVHLTRRPGTQDIFAWSHQQGPLVSNDGGASWQRMRLGAAFRSALAGSVVTHFIANQDHSYFAVTRSRTPNQPTQLWRSADGAETWQAIYSFMESADETPMRLLRVPGGGPLLMAHGSRLAVSNDSGETWAALAGPWERGALTGMENDDGRVVLVMHLPHTSEIAWLDDPTDGGGIVASHRLNWPSNWRLVGDRPVGMDVRGQRVILKESDTIYGGIVPRRQTRLPNSFAILVSLGAIFFLSAIVFAYLRTVAK